jgi:hypothetical protein
MTKPFLAAVLLALAAVAAAPTASAQGTGLTLVAEDLATPVPFEGSSAIPFTLEVGCLGAVTGQTTTVTVAPTGEVPSWLTVTPFEGEVAPASCLTGMGTQSITGTIPIAVTADAPGVVDHTLNLVASLGSATSEDAAVFTVAYEWNYSLVPDVTFPLAVTGPSVSFNLTVTQASNARSMVMMEEVQTSAGVISGLTSMAYENQAGQPATKTFTITYTAPTGAWDNATVNFVAYGHFLLLDSRAGDYDDGTPITWTFSNAGSGPSGGDGGEKESPAPAGVLLALGLVALAALARRKSA